MTSEFDTSMFAKGYVKLPSGSYRLWISKKWHEMFVRRGLVSRNFYGQFNPDTISLREFIIWLKLYDASCHDRNFPNSKPQLKIEQLAMIRKEVI